MHTITPAHVARQITVARAQRAHRPVFTSETGVTRPERRAAERAAFGSPVVCQDVLRYGEHVLSIVEADLPGDRSVGHCHCGVYVDTGTWDERNA